MDRGPSDLASPAQRCLPAFGVARCRHKLPPEAPSFRWLISAVVTA
jgi:hypothetical protein